jgi:1-acyl-sn-glycerol-3-phosphate acyltransferase|tara:strand:+ start:1754 stop:2581 length:828 start_codon:yes stop_codon:yes gene_type:complete
MTEAALLVAARTEGQVSTLRSLIFGALWGLWTVLFGLAIPFLWIARAKPSTVRMLSRVWARGVLSMLVGIVGLRHRERGREHVSRTPGLIVSNHQSTWETLAALVMFPDVAIVAKQELLHIPVMGWYLTNSPMILIDRASASAALREMTLQGRAALAAGRPVLIFPEGTRKAVGEPIVFRRGVEFLYKALGVPALPVVLDSGRFWSVGGLPKRAGIITVSFLEPISPGLSTKDFTRTAQASMHAEAVGIEKRRVSSLSCLSANCLASPQIPELRS